MTSQSVSSQQLLMLLVVSRVTFTLGYFPAMANPDLKQDAWLACLLGAAAGIPFAYLLNLLWSRFPRQTFAEVVELTLGTALARVVVGCYAVVLLMLFALDLRLAVELIIYALLERTPPVVLIVTVAVLATWAAKAGITVIARASQVIFPLLLGSIALVFLLLLKDIRFGAFLPVFIQSGPVAHLKETIQIVGRNLEFIAVGLVIPSVTDRHNLMRTMVLTFVWMGFIWALMAISITGLLGPFQDLLYFPFYSVTRSILVADVLERIDFVIVGIWSFGMYLRGGLTLWACSQYTARLFGIRDRQPLVIALAGLGVTLSLITGKSLNEVRFYLRGESFVPFMLTCILLIPMLVLGVALLRGVSGSAGASPDEKAAR